MDDGTGDEIEGVPAVGPGVLLDESRTDPPTDPADDSADDSRRIDAGGRSTTTIPRPQARRASDAGRVRVADLRARRELGDRGDRIAPHRRTAWLFGLGALVVAAAIAAALFGLPARTWFAQDDDLARLRHELSEVNAVNSDLDDEVQILQTDEGIGNAVRDELGNIAPGERREALQELPPLPTDLPNGWPYSPPLRIIALRRAAMAAATTTTAVPATSTTTAATTAAATAAATTTLAAATTTGAAAATTVTAATTASTVRTTAAPTTTANA